MSPYSQQELARQDLIKEMDAKNLSVEDLNEEQVHVLKRQIPENYYKYKLKGIVVHYGTADQGHYYSFVQDREGKNEGWFEFNDTKVSDFDPKEIPEEAFGGEDNSIQNLDDKNMDAQMLQAMKQFKNKIKNAYILIYDRVEQFETKKINKVIDDIKSVQISSKELKKQYEACRYVAQSTLPPMVSPDVQDVIIGKN
jgi:hypothetical protein